MTIDELVSLLGLQEIHVKHQRKTTRIFVDPITSFEYKISGGLGICDINPVGQNFGFYQTYTPKQLNSSEKISKKLWFNLIQELHDWIITRRFIYPERWFKEKEWEIVCQKTKIYEDLKDSGQDSGQNIYMLFSKKFSDSYIQAKDLLVNFYFTKNAFCKYPLIWGFEFKKKKQKIFEHFTMKEIKTGKSNMKVIYGMICLYPPKLPKPPKPPRLTIGQQLKKLEESTS